MENEIQLLASLVKFRDAAQQLLENWYKPDAQNMNAAYPFDKSFDEVLSDINIWVETQTNTGKH